MSKTTKMTAKNDDGEMVEFKVGQFVEFKYGIEQEGKIIELNPGRREVLVKADDNGGERGRPTWIQCNRCYIC